MSISVCPSNPLSIIMLDDFNLHILDPSTTLTSSLLTSPLQWSYPSGNEPKLELTIEQ